MTRKKKITPEARECITKCKECAEACIAAIPHAIEVEGEHFSRPQVSLLQLCADICHISARSLLKGVEFHDPILRACASVCEACARECEELNDDYMRKCADICRDCASSCRQFGRPKRVAA